MRRLSLFSVLLEAARHQPTTMAAKTARLSLAFPKGPVSLELHAAGQGPVNHQIGSSRKTRGGAGEKDDAAANLLRLGHPPGRVQRPRLLIEVGQVLFDV